MAVDIKKITETLKRDKFIKVTNVNEFPELSVENKLILENYGLPSNKFGSYPIIISDGKLKKTTTGLIEIGTYQTNSKYYIDPSNGQIKYYDSDSGEYDVVNTSLHKFLECKYTIAIYYTTIEFPQKYGNYNLDDNNLKYTKILRDMLNGVEPEIENYETWNDYLFQKELGVI